jgi:hypothetical protein
LPAHGFLPLFRDTRRPPHLIWPHVYLVEV